MKIDKTQLKEILVKEVGFAEFDADLFCKEFPDELPEELASSMNSWLKDRTIEDVTVDGLALSAVMQKQHSHFLAAIKSLSILLDPNKSTEEKEKYKQAIMQAVHFE